MTDTVATYYVRDQRMSSKAGKKPDVQRLANELTADPAYVTGARPFPRALTDAEAIAIAEALQAEVDRGAAARANQIGKQGLKLACGRGCNGCCEEPIMVYRPESIAVARWLQRPGNAPARESFLAAYAAWRERAGHAPARLSALSGNDDAEAYRAAHVDGWRRRALCAFNQDGDCSIYPVRPMTCRNAHALESSDRCNGASPLPAARVTFVPLDQFLARARLLLSAANNATGGPPARLEALCDAVHALLAESS